MQPDFLQIPREVYGNKELDKLDCFVYAAVYWFHSLKNGKCTASNRRIGEVVGAAAGSVKNSLNRLEDQRCIKRIYKDQQQKVRLQIIPLVVYAKIRHRVASTDARVASTDARWVASTDAQSIKSPYRKDIKGEHSKNEQGEGKNANAGTIQMLNKVRAELRSKLAWR